MMPRTFLFLNMSQDYSIMGGWHNEAAGVAKAARLQNAVAGHPHAGYGQGEEMKVSVIVTIKNEGEAIRLLLDSLLNQTMLPDEIVMCDGGSTDDTLAILDEYRRWLPLRVVSAPGSNISQGRNRAIEAAAGPIIAATDAGVVLSPVWLEQITRPIRDGR